MHVTQSLKFDAVIILTALFSFQVFGTLGGAVLAYCVVASGPWIGDEAITAMFWIQWGGRIIGRFAGDSICGLLLGRFLRRVNPWHVLLCIAMVPIAIILINHGFWDANDGLWIHYVGTFGGIIQLVIQVAAMVAVVAIGICLGRRCHPSNKVHYQTNREVPRVRRSCVPAATATMAGCFLWKRFLRSVRSASTHHDRHPLHQPRPHSSACQLAVWTAAPYSNDRSCDRHDRADPTAEFRHHRWSRRQTRLASHDSPTLKSSIWIPAGK